MSLTEEQAFLQRVRARPHDDGPRLIYADWLDERDDPRGEFIRVQVAVERLLPDDPLRQPLVDRERELLDRHEPEWTAAVKPLVSECSFRRGLLDSVSVEADRFAEVAEMLFLLAPVRRVKLIDAGRQMRRVTRTRALLRVRELDLCANDLGNGGVNALCRSPYVEHLQVLNLSHNGISDRGVVVLAECSRLTRLRTLSLEMNDRIGQEGTQALGESRHLRLTTLDLSANALNDLALRNLLRSEAMRGLSWLGFQENQVGDSGIQELVATPLLGRMLRRSPVLDLRQNSISRRGARAIADSPNMRPVEVLDFTKNNVGDLGLAALAISEHMPNLRRLKLRDNRIGDEGALALAESPLLQRLEYLDLRENDLTNEGIALLREPPHSNWRARIDVDDSPLISRRFGRLRHPRLL